MTYLKLYILESPIEGSCQNCPNCRWVQGQRICTDARDTKGDFRISTDIKGFPEWCPLSDITWTEFNERVNARNSKKVNG
jgi:hypothetical protein